MNKRIVFAGGTDWSVEFFTTLLEEGFKIVGVLTPEDNRQDRSQKNPAPALKIEAEKRKIPVYQPEKLSDPEFLKKFKTLQPDLVVAVAYGKLFPKNILEIPPLGFINFHPSLLPKLRGPSPIASAILEGHQDTGVSIMKLGEGMDDGPILAQKNVKIDLRETSETLTMKLVELGKKILPDVLKEYLDGRITLKPQIEKEATVCKMIQKEDGRINWQNETAEEIDRKIRALNPQFKTFTLLANNKRVNIVGSAGIAIEQMQPGSYKLIDKNLAVGTKKNILLINKLQVEGKKPISAEEFVRGYREDKFSSQ